MKYIFLLFLIPVITFSQLTRVPTGASSDSTKTRSTVLIRDSAKVTVHGFVRLARSVDTTTATTAVRITSSQTLDSLTNLLREQQGYRITDDSIRYKVINTCITYAGVIADSSTSWTRIWTTSSADSIKSKVISFISIATGDSSIGYQILAFNGTNIRRLFYVPRVVSNAQITMNFVNTPIILAPNEYLFARIVVPNNHYNYTNLITSVTTGTPNLVITVKYKYR